VQQQIAGDFKEEVAKKKIPKINPYCRLVIASLCSIVSAANHVDAIENGNDKKQEDRGES